MQRGPAKIPDFESGMVMFLKTNWGVAENVV